MNKKEQRYSIRKLKVAVCSIAIASILLGVAPILGESLNSLVIVNAQEETINIKESQVEINSDTVVVRIEANSNAQFKLKFGNDTHNLIETPSNEQGISTYEVTVPRGSVYELPVISISYVYNNQEKTITYDDYVGLREELSKIQRTPIYVTGNEPTDADIATLVEQLKTMYTEAGYPVENPDSDIVIDKNNGTIAITTKFSTDDVWNLRKEYTGIYKINSFVVYTKESSVKNSTVKLSNYRIGGGFVAPRETSAKIVYGTAEIPMFYSRSRGQYIAVDTQVNELITDNIVKMILTKADGTTEEKIINIQDGDFNFVPYHVQADRFVKQKNSITKLYREDSSVPLTNEEIEKIIENVENSLENAPFKDKVTQVYSLSSNIIIRFENTTLSDGTVVSYEYYIPATNLVEYPDSEEEVPFETEYVADDTLENGTQQVETEGQNGINTTTITYLTNINTNESAGTEKTTVLTKEVVNKVVRVGTKPTVTVEEVPFETEFVEDKTIEYPLGEFEVEGVDGTITTTTTYTVDPTTGEVIANEPTVESVAAITEVIRVGTKPVVTKEEVPFETEYVADDTLENGIQQVEVEGVAGEDTITTTFTFDATTAEVTMNEPVTERTREVVNKVVKVGTKPTVTVEEVPFEIEYVNDETLENGVQQVEVEGENGEDTTTITYTLNSQTGELTASDPVQIRTKEAVKKVVKVGTKEKAIIKPIDKDSKNSENKQSNKEESQTLPKTGDNNSNVFSLGLVLISASLYVASKKRNK